MIPAELYAAAMAGNMEAFEQVTRDPTPVRVQWWCTACEVGWASVEAGVCWNCGSDAHISDTKPIVNQSNYSGGATVEDYAPEVGA